MVNFSANDQPAANKNRSTSHNSNLNFLSAIYQGDERDVETFLTETFFKVERAKQEWESTVDALPELIGILDGHGRIVRINRTIERWQLGNVKMVKGQTFHNLVHPHCEQPCYLHNAIRQAIDHGTTGGIEKEVYDRALHRYISLRVRPIVVKDGDTQGHGNWVVILKDISVRKQAEQALYRQNGRLVTLNAINKAILAADSPEAIAQATLKRIQPLVPYQQAHLLVKTPETSQLLVLAAYSKNPGLNLAAGQKMPEKVFTLNEERSLHQFFVVKSLNNLLERTEIEEQWWAHGINSYMNVPLNAGDYTIGVLQLATNDPAIFEPEQIEVIREIAETLTIAIQQSQLHQKLGRTNDELRRILRARHEVMQDISHDLRSPLALIKGYAEMLKDGFLGPLSDEQQRALKVIDKKGEQLLGLVNKIFKLQTVDKGSLDKAPFNPNHHLSDLVQSWQVLTANKNIRLQLEITFELPVIMADANLLDQVFTNLLDNALKFSTEGGNITIRAWTEGMEIIVAISDQGQGISPSEIAQIFERYYQIKNSGQAKAGAGIGLALCKTIVEAHDGRIWVQSDGKEQGATFFIALPLPKIQQTS